MNHDLWKMYQRWKKRVFVKFRSIQDEAPFVPAVFVHSLHSPNLIAAQAYVTV